MLAKHTSASQRQAFTLTELAIVLGIMGTILGAIWVAASKVTANQKTQKAVAETIQIVNNYRTLYAQHGVDVADGTEITCLGVNAGFFPPDMLTVNSLTSCAGKTGGPPSGGATSGVGARPSTPWAVSTWTAGGGSNDVSVEVYGVSNPMIWVRFRGLSQAACESLMIALTSTSGLVYQGITNYGTLTNQQYLAPYTTSTPWTPATIDGYCDTASDNAVMVGYLPR